MSIRLYHNRTVSRRKVLVEVFRNTTAPTVLKQQSGMWPVISLVDMFQNTTLPAV